MREGTSRTLQGCGPISSILGEVYVDFFFDAWLISGRSLVVGARLCPEPSYDDDDIHIGNHFLRRLS
jgi:hypothetical protein